MIRELCSKYLSNNLSMIYAYLTTVNAHDKPLGEHSDNVIKEIKERTLFKNINYDLESVVTQDVNLQEFGENNKELVVQLLDKVKDYKTHILEQLDIAYEDIKFRLESYYRNQIKEMKNNVATNLETEKDFDPAEALTKITNEHKEMLVAIREQYAGQMTRIEQDHQLILQKLLKSEYLEHSDSAELKEQSNEDIRTLKDCGISENKLADNSNNGCMNKQHAVEKCKSVLKITPVSTTNKIKEIENKDSLS